MTEQEAVEFGKAVGDLTRQRILRFCCCTPKSVGDIAKQVEVRQPTASHHLAILEKAKLVERDQHGKVVYYQVNQERMANCCGALMMNLAPEDSTTQAFQAHCCEC
ncbi:ArsR/SmtB family transcription factor [Coraliomargarita akajimensis]|uniref:Transcriptional regulator, ArsR family n=1 Tax=Coraliomargarita akajimensis (strain DSM 45221 / IAM 15411 / JCM 23193 / KCTC 12865 / 04OKA010-24) TaxID=583355 RepID=D5EIW7_CORAD|nr:metalloregulator ArsR/SmtB family transcription factor [Coraliomargarita akajimensis]ADE54366.1 transcriptional regulator, ArsR family [Coraliomargarita akajimensis DSM 45221]